MKKKIGYILCVFLAACFFAGCGGEFAGLSREEAASGGAVSGGAVSVLVENERPAWKYQLSLLSSGMIYCIAKGGQP